MLAKSKLAEFIAAKTSADPIGPARRRTWATSRCSRADSLMRICTRR